VPSGRSLHPLLLAVSGAVLAAATTIGVASPASAAGGPYRAEALPLIAPAAAWR